MVELNKTDIQNLLVLINNSQIPGSGVEAIAGLKQKLAVMFKLAPEVQQAEVVKEGE